MCVMFPLPTSPTGVMQMAQRDSETGSGWCYRKGTLSLGTAVLSQTVSKPPLCPRGRHQLNLQGCLLQTQLQEMARERAVRVLHTLNQQDVLGVQENRVFLNNIYAN